MIASIHQPHPPRGVILEADALSALGKLPTASIDTVVTSPPYFRLRNYGVDGQLGLERSVEEWVSELRAIARQLARVLVPTGTLWLNLGDSYSTHVREGAPRKSLLFGPERLAMALSEDGWILRNKIVWAKTNTTPSSVTDRLSTKHEVIYVLSRAPRYFFDLDAIRIPHTSRRPKPRATSPIPQPARPSWLGPNSDGDRGLAAMHRDGIQGHPLGKNPGDVWTLSVSRYPGAHFATYPVHLVTRMLLAGCPERRCVKCRAPWTRPLKRHGRSATRLPLAPTCDCSVASEPGLVLDPFMGSGTTALAAEQLGRDWLGIELNPQFAKLARERLASARITTTTNRKEVA